MRKLPIFCVAAAFVANAYGSGRDAVAVHGFDKMSCGDWRLSRSDSPVREQYVAWMRGIVTGYNYANPTEQIHTDRMPDDASLALYVDGYCRDRPLTPFVGAVFALIDELHGKARRETSPLPASEAAGETTAFQTWLKQQSVDMQSLDIEVLRNIYSREVALKSK